MHRHSACSSILVSFRTPSEVACIRGVTLLERLLCRQQHRPGTGRQLTRSSASEASLFPGKSVRRVHMRKPRNRATCSVNSVNKATSAEKPLMLHAARQKAQSMPDTHRVRLTADGATHSRHRLHTPPQHPPRQCRSQSRHDIAPPPRRASCSRSHDGNHGRIRSRQPSLG